MATFVDTHAHLYDEQYAEDLAVVIEKSIAQGIKAIYLPNINVDTLHPMMEVVHEYAICKPMLGLHPCDVKQDFKQQLRCMEPWFSKHDFVGIGEVGLDLYRDTTYYAEQVEALHVFIDWALGRCLPLVLHVRNAMDQMIALLKERQKGSLKGIVHCFSGNVAQARQVVDLGFALGIGGVVTFKNNKLVDVVQHIDIDHIVLETDSPYLAPASHRGKRNYPGLIPEIAGKIAAIKGMDIERVAARTTANADAIFAGQNVDGLGKKTK